MNEVFWTTAPSPEKREASRREVGGVLVPLEQLKRLWDESGLSDRIIKTHTIDARREMRGRV